MLQHERPASSVLFSGMGSISQLGEDLATASCKEKAHFLELELGRGSLESPVPLFIKEYDIP